MWLGGRRCCVWSEHSRPEFAIFHSNWISSYYKNIKSYCLKLKLSWIKFLIFPKALYDVCEFMNGKIWWSSPCIMCVQYIGGYHEYIGGIPWIHRRDTMSTSGSVQYIGGIPWVHRGCSVHRGESWVHRGRDIMSTSGRDIMSTSGEVQYIGGISWSDVGGYHEYIGWCSVHRGIPWVHRRDTMSTSGISWVHRGCSVHQGMFSTSGVSIEIERILSSCSPTCIMISPRCTEHPLMYSWCPLDVLMVSLRCTEHLPMYSSYPPHSSWYPLMYSWYPPDVLNAPNVLNIPRCTEHTLYRVILHTWVLWLNHPHMPSDVVCHAPFVD